MAISNSFRFSLFPHLSLRSPLRRCILQVRLGHAADVESFDDTENQKVNGVSDVDEPKWKKLSSTELGINNSKISKPTRKVLNGLKRKGFDVYLAGGCVRDLILKRVLKDFDVITSAELKEVMRTFPTGVIIGRRFPICLVHIDDSTVEVSSFSTRATRFGKILNFEPEKPIGCAEDDYVRWKNCLQRDFTINGLMFDPYKKLVYDYMGGVDDIKKAKLRTIKPAGHSFLEDCARILRGVRIAARLSFRISKETAIALKSLSASVLRLDKGRLFMEVNYMLAYGSAEASIRLLWKLGLLERLLPIQAAYFVHIGFSRRDKRSNMLLSLLSNLDKHLAPDRPCHGSLWVAILSFHKALSDRPTDPLVVAAYCLAVHNGGDLVEALNIAGRISKRHDTSLHELLDPIDLDPGSLAEEVMSLADSVRSAVNNLTDEYSVSQAMAKYPKAPFSNLVFINFAIYFRVCKIFDCVQGGNERGFVQKHGSKIDYEMLLAGNLKEVRHVFARVVFDTIYPIDTAK